MSAMENASKNAKEIFDKLTLQYNKARQARITMELVEIISGASALWSTKDIECIANLNIAIEYELNWDLI